MPAFRSRRVVTENGVRPATVFVERGKIERIGAWEEPSDDVVDVGPLVLAPGLVDSHVHVNEPGRTHWEGFHTATRAAAAGGVTTLVDMPLNSIPPTTSVAGLLAKAQAAEGKCHVDVGLCGGLVPGNAKDLRAIRDAGALSFKCFLAPSGVDEFPHVEPDDLAAGMRALAEVGAPLLVHAELPGPLRDPAGPPRSYATWLDARPAAAEEEAIALVLRLVEETRARAHVVHLSAASALGLFVRARERALPLSVETCPHYLHFASERIPDGAVAYKCAPPIRGEANRAALWDALRQGLVDQVVTDHSPASPDVKCADSGDFAKAWGGIASLQIGLPVVWSEARRRGVAFETVVRWMSEAPAKLVGLWGRKGAIAPGFDADLVAWDPDAAMTVGPLFHRHPMSPYVGETLYGRVHATWLRGRKVYGDGAHLGAPEGRWLRG